MEKSILFSSVIMLSVITAFTSIREEKKPVAPEMSEIKTFVADTIPDKLNEDELSNSETRKRKKMMRDTERKMEKKHKELEKIQQKLQEVQIQIENDMQLKNEVLQKQMIELENQININNEKMQVQELQLAQAEQAMKDVDMERINRDVKKALKAVDMEKINREVQAATLDAIEQNKLRGALTLRPGYMNDDIASVLEFLEENNVAEAKDVKSFTLNNDELTVNGTKQAETLHQQLKERYIRDKGDHIIYSNSNGSKSITIRRNDPR